MATMFPHTSKISFHVSQINLILFLIWLYFCPYYRGNREKVRKRWWLQEERKLCIIVWQDTPLSPLGIPLNAWWSYKISQVWYIIKVSIYHKSLFQFSIICNIVDLLVYQCCLIGTPSFAQMQGTLVLFYILIVNRREGFRSLHWVRIISLVYRSRRKECCKLEAVLILSKETWGKVWDQWEFG